MEARMVLTSSYGAKQSRTVVGSTSMRIRSSTVTVAPMPPRSSTVVVTSFRWGTLPTTTGPSASSAPARIGRVAFLAPEMRTSPWRGTPPWICSLSISLPSGFGRRQGLDRQRMDLAPHPLSQGLIHELMARDAALAGELLGDDAGVEMGVVIRLHPNIGSRQAGADQPRNLLGTHEPDIIIPCHELCRRLLGSRPPAGRRPPRPGHRGEGGRGADGAARRPLRRRLRGLPGMSGPGGRHGHGQVRPH